jgi:zinc D-Ala-D-Ala carboxypeptidase
MTQLTKNFSLHELTKSETAARHDMENNPGPTEIANLTELAGKVLQPIRDHFAKGVHINSGFRHPDVNAKVGGSRTSDHTRGMAADLEIPGVLILEFYTPGIPDSGWVHVSYDPKNLKKQVMTATKQNGKTVYLPGLVA